MDDKIARREARLRGLEPLWMLRVLDKAANLGLVNHLSEKLDTLVNRTSFYASATVLQFIAEMKRREWVRLQEQQRDSGFERGR